MPMMLEGVTAQSAISHEGVSALRVPRDTADATPMVPCCNGEWKRQLFDPTSIPETTLHTIEAMGVFNGRNTVPVSPNGPRCTGPSLDNTRDRWLSPPDADEATRKKRTLTNLYNERPTWLAHLHAARDRAVWSAYGWEDDPAQTSDEAILERVLALNHQRAPQAEPDEAR